MFSRVQALETLNMQKDDASRALEDDIESLATIRAPRPDLSSGDMLSGSEHFDFFDELQRSRVYRRNRAFRESVVSGITNSVYSLGYSFFSDLSMAEVSNISVINLAVTKREVTNPGRSLQTWSPQPNRTVSIDEHVDEQRTQLPGFSRGPVQTSTSLATARGPRPASTQIQQRSLPGTFSPLSKSQPLDRRNNYPQWTERVGTKATTRSAEDLNLTSTPLPPDPSGSLSHLQVQAISSPQPNQKVDDEAECPCKGCGKVCFTPPRYLLAEPQLVCVVDRSANDCNLHLGPRARKSLRDWYVFPTTKILLQNLKTDNPSAGYRWHIDCFHCSTCGTPLNTDASILLLSNGSLICNDCKYSCSACNNEIEDSAILTEDQAFCATCFNCRNCHKGIESLRYARTSQGIFCMECYKPKRCRRCNKAIGNQPYSRSSRGISCIECHESKQRQRKRDVGKQEQPAASPLRVQHPLSKEMAAPIEAERELRNTISDAEINYGHGQAVRKGRVDAFF